MSEEKQPMTLDKLPQNAFDVHIKNGFVCHYKHRITVTAATRLECLQKIRKLNCGRLEHLPALIGTTWQATFVQSMTFDPPKEMRKSN